MYGYESVNSKINICSFSRFFIVREIPTLGRKILLLTVSSIITLLVAEIMLQLFWTNSYENTGADTILKLRINHHNLNLTLDRSKIDQNVPFVSVRTNSRGYIEPTIRFEPPDYTIAFLGGSTTACAAVQEELRFPALVSKLLEERGLKVNTLNAGRAGGTLHDSINILLNHVVQDHPDVIVVMHALNDTALIRTDNYKSRMGHEVSLTDVVKYLAQLGSIHSSLIGLVRKAVITTGNISPDPDQYINRPQTIDSEPFRARLNIFVEMCRAFGIKPVLLTQPFSPMIKNDLTPDWMNPTALTAFNQVIREVVDKKNAHLVDLAAYIAEKGVTKDEVRKIFYDGIHVTDYGSRIYAIYLADRLYEILTTETTYKAKQ